MPLRIASNRPSVLWNGAFFVTHSLALVNRELTLGLLADETFRSHFDLSLRHFESPVFDGNSDPRFAPLVERLRTTPEAPRLTIRHHWPPDFAKPAAGGLVLMQPWEFGSLPRTWVREIAESVEEVWAYSNFVRDTYLQSGVPASKVQLVPCGVNTERFHPDVAPYDFAANPKTAFLGPDTYKFLFVGGTIPRKGIDVLLDAFDRAFKAKDDVALIIKDFGINSFYANQTMTTLIQALQAKPGGAKIVYLTDDMSESEIASLYAACDCLVHPYRGEGYGLPIAEAMACGKPTILTGYGAALDFATETNSYLLPSRLVRLPEKRVGDMETVDYPFLAEPDRDALSERLQYLVNHRAEATARGTQAAADIAAGHTWKQAAERAAARISELASRPLETKTGVTLPITQNIGGLKVRGSETVYEEQKQAALAATRAGKWNEAQTALELCLKERPQDWDTINALAVARFRVGEIDSARALLERGIAEAPNARDFHHNLAFLLLETGAFEEALSHALSALSITSDNADIRRTVERAREGVLKLSRKVLRSYPDKQRNKAKNDPEYLRLNALYRESGERLEAKLQASVPAPVSAAKPEKPRLSLVMIVKNEERFLRNCLESVRGIVDEIVIVDTGSTDSTITIAQQFGAKIVPHVWKDDFSEARNISLDHATGDWALWLDADEEIAPECRNLIRPLIEKSDRNIGGYLIQFRNWLSSTTRKADSEVAVHHACRLFRRLPEVRFEGRIHEQNIFGLQRLNMMIAHAKGIVIDHFGYAAEVMTMRNKHERFIRMLTREVEECPNESLRVFHRFNLGNAYYTAGDMKNAAIHLEHAVAGADLTEEYTYSAFTQLVTAYQALGKPEDGLRICEKADKMGMRYAGLEFARGHCYLPLKHYTEAENSFRTALRYGADETIQYAKTGDIGAGTFKARYGLALALTGQDKYGEALTHCDYALREQAGFVDCRYLHSIILVRLKRPAEAIATLRILVEQVPNHANAVNDLGGLLLGQEAYREALPYLRRGTTLNPMDDEALARFASCCEQLQMWSEASDAYRRLRRLRPHSSEVCVNMGRVLATSGSSSEAIECFSEAIRLNPQYGNAYFNAGDLLYKLGFYDRAAETYISGLEIEPQNPSGFFMLGNCYYQQGVYEAAVLSYQQALTQNPAHQEARHNLDMAREQIEQPTAQAA